MLKLKICSLCKKEKPDKEFYARGEPEKGTRSSCKQCVNEASVARRAYKAQHDGKSHLQVNRAEQAALLKDGLASCTFCGEIKKLEQFHKNSRAGKPVASWCRSCCALKAKDYKPRATNQKLLKAYGISTVERQAMLEAQNMSCAICREEFLCSKHTHVDHCHGTGTVRGMLCNKCNAAVGLLKDSPVNFSNAADYLKKNLQPVGHSDVHWLKLAPPI